MLNKEQFLYHEVNSQYRNKIERRGLDPSKYETGGVWFSTKHEPQEGFDSWKIRAKDVPGLVHGSEGSAEWSPEDSVYVTYENVSPQKLLRV